MSKTNSIVTGSPVPRRRGRSCVGGLALVAVGLAPAMADAVETVCPPPPEGVFGLPGGPKFAEIPPLPGIDSQLDDPRWNGNYRQDFSDASSTESAVRMLKEGDALFLSFEARADPDGATPLVDGVYVGFSKDGVTAVMAKVMLTGVPPLTNANAITAANWWKTTGGGATPWQKQASPQTWATPTNVHAWSGTAGTGTGSSWAVNAKLSLADLGAALGLGGALTGPFFMWFEINVQTIAGAVPYDWPSGATLGFDTTTAPCTGTAPCAVLPVATFGVAYPALSSDCPTGIKIDPMSIGVFPPLANGLPGTMVHYGSGHPPNDFVAVMTDTSGASIAPNTVEGRFRIANWGTTIGRDGDWKDMVVNSGGAAILGVNATNGAQVSLHCVNPPFGATDQRCFQLAASAPPDQCLLVELAQRGGSGAKFVSSSARRNMDFVDASTFERSAEISLRGLAPLPGSSGTRDVYIYVRTLNMPAVTKGNPPIVIPPPVPPASRDRQAQAGAADPKNPPRYRSTTYDRFASVMPTYEVHVYYDTGRTRFEEGAQRRILQPLAPFGYFVQHAGDLSGWRHALAGEGFALEELGPNFYHAKIPDNGSVRVHTKIDSCKRVLLGLVNQCGSGCGSCQCSTAGNVDEAASLGALALAICALACGLRRPSRSRRRATR